ncbi:MAG: hypothetical protein AAF849_01690 [Bacteroidota bacterium]
MINKKEVNRLMEVVSDHCISIYIPTFRVGNVQEDNLRFKNTLSEALDHLQARGLEKKEAHQFLMKGYELLDNDNFWLRQSDGLAVFISKDHFEYYRLPIHFKKRVHVYTQYYIRPLMPMFTENGRFFLLALSQNDVRFFEGDRYSITPIIIKDLVPANMEKALLYDPNTSLQMHSGNGNDSKGIFHGHGLGKNKEEAYLKEYFSMIDKGLMEMLHDENAPMILATVDENAPIYRDVSNYNHIMDVNVSGNPDNSDPVKLHERAWSIMTDLDNKNRNNFKENFGAYLADNQASTFLTDIVPAAVEGKIESIFMNYEEDIFGRYDREKHRAEIHEEQQNDSYELLEFTARNVFMQGGKVFNVPKEEFPQQESEVNAIYRF